MKAIEAKGWTLEFDVFYLVSPAYLADPVDRPWRKQLQSFKHQFDLAEGIGLLKYRPNHTASSNFRSRNVKHVNTPPKDIVAIINQVKTNGKGLLHELGYYQELLLNGKSSMGVLAQ